MTLIISLFDEGNQPTGRKLISLQVNMNVISRPLEFSDLTETVTAYYLTLQKKLLHTCIFNFLLLALLGLLLRAYPIFSIPFLSYKNILHAHSHFAFGGWIMPVLFHLVLKFFPETRTVAAYRHWRNIIILTMVSAYGMLLSFPFQGYGAISIVFSTLSIVAGFYAGIIIRQATRPQYFQASWAFLAAGFFYFAVAAAGPFATGPLIAMGKAGTALYYNAIYFYLHFQYNGFFTFIVLAVIYKMVERHKPFNNGKLVFTLLNLACIPAYALSVLWTKPSILLNITGGAAAILQLTAVIVLLNDIKRTRWKTSGQRWLFNIAIFAFILKNFLQLLSAFPQVAEMAYQNRNFVIAYLHLVLIGFISVFVFAVILRPSSFLTKRLLYFGFLFFLVAFITTEILLVLQAAGFVYLLQPLLYYQLLFGLSCLFPVGLLLMYFGYRRQTLHMALS